MLPPPPRSLSLSLSSPMIRRLSNSLSPQTLTKHNPIFSLFTKPTSTHLRLHSLSSTTTTARAPQRLLLSPTHKMSINNLHSVPIPQVDKASKSELLRALESSIGSTFSTDPIQPRPVPLIVVISGPSGVGKDAVIKKLRETRSNLHFVVTATSRPMRPGEVDGKDYIFVSKEEFLQMVEMDELLEYALVYGDYKGIPKNQIREFMSKGCDIVLRVDIQGARTLRRILGDSAIFVFVVAGSEMEMVERLIDRKTESGEELLVRIATAREEVKHIKSFDYVVVNSQGKLDEAVRLLESIIDAEKAKVRQRNVAI